MMKQASLIIVGCFLVGCAHGVDPEPVPIPETVITVDPPTPPPQTVESDTPTEDNCYSDSYWVNHCLVTKRYCDGELERVDVKCNVGRPLLPWEYIPDPAPYQYF